MNWQKIDWISNKNYSISDTGLVRNDVTNCIRVLEKHYKGYYRVMISAKHYLVHRLVATAFVTNVDLKPHVNHKDGNKLNNNANNLEWCTAQENNIHAIATGLRHKSKGNYIGNPKVTIEDVLEIRKISFFYTFAELSEMYNISKRAVQNIVYYRTWKNICEIT